MSTAISPPRPSNPAFRALISGFERIAARPYLILPPLALDLFLWLGPRLHLDQVFELAAEALSASAARSPELAEQVALVQDSILALTDRYNLFSVLSTFPIGVPSLMATTMPAASPLGEPARIYLSEAVGILGIWLALTVVGLGLAALYHRALSTAAAPGAPAGIGPLTWLRVLGMAAVAYLAIGVVAVGTAFAGSFVSLFVPYVGAFLGPGIVFLGFTLLFWLAVYLAFTPHGLVRDGMGLFGAMRASADLVRRNFFSAVGFLATAVLLSWAAGYVWELPTADSWFTSLAVVGHAFVSAMLLVASYIFYVGRREAILAAARPASSAADPSADRRHASGA